MKICCSQEHYDKVVQYAKSINDKTLENCLERLKQWEKNENRPCEIELYYDNACISVRITFAESERIRRMVVIEFDFAWTVLVLLALF